MEDNNNNLQQTYHLNNPVAVSSNLNKLELPRQDLTFTKHLTGLLPFNKRYLDQHKLTSESKNCDIRNLSASETTPSTSKLQNSDTKQVAVDSASDSSDDTKKEKLSEHTISSDDDKQRTKKMFKCDECGKCFKQLRNYKYHR